MSDAMTTADLEEIIDAEIVEDMTEPVARTPRQQKLKELRDFLDFLERNEDIVIPYSMDSIAFHNIHTVQEAAKTVKRIGGKWSKNNPNGDSDYDKNYFEMTTNLDRLTRVTIAISRGLVCERKVVGKVMKSVPVTVYEDRLVDEVEFECGSLLSANEKARIAELEAMAS